MGPTPNETKPKNVQRLADEADIRKAYVDARTFEDIAAFSVAAADLNILSLLDQFKA